MIQLNSINFDENNKDNFDNLIIFCLEDEVINENKLITNLVQKAKKIKGFSGENGQEISFYEASNLKFGINAKKIMLIGLGKAKELKLNQIRKAIGKSVKSCIKNKLSEVNILSFQFKKLKLDESDIFTAMIEGAYLGNHIFDKYKSKKKDKALKNISFLVNPKKIKSLNKILDKTVNVCEGTVLARELVSMPSNEKTPEKLAKIISNIAKKQNLKVEIFDEKKLKQEKFSLLLGVGSGSINKPQLLILDHNPQKAKKCIVLVGKGITFDTGGINLKPGSAMSGMKADMSGAAAVAATMIALSKNNNKARVVGVMPLVENMPSGSAMRPEDIIESYSGKTVEIGNTDAEGRLILADAISFAQKKYKPEILIDVATLTGACLVALGEKIAGLFATDEKLGNEILASGEKTYERCWKLPMPEDYKEFLKSNVADIKNTSSVRWGGVITAALFLAEFVNIDKNKDKNKDKKDKAKWAHLDIAGPSFDEKGNDYCQPGGTGFGVRLLCDLLEKI